MIIQRFPFLLKENILFFHALPRYLLGVLALYGAAMEGLAVDSSLTLVDARICTLFSTFPTTLQGQYFRE